MRVYPLPAAMELWVTVSSAKATKSREPALGVKLFEIGVVVGVRLKPLVVEIVPSPALDVNPEYSTAVMPPSPPGPEIVTVFVPAAIFTAYQIAIDTGSPLPAPPSPNGVSAV